jgi:hypothetical protein
LKRYRRPGANITTTPEGKDAKEYRWDGTGFCYRPKWNFMCFARIRLSGLAGYYRIIAGTYNHGGYGGDGGPPQALMDLMKFIDRGQFIALVNTGITVSQGRHQRHHNHVCGTGAKAMGDGGPAILSQLQHPYA